MAEFYGRKIVVVVAGLSISDLRISFEVSREIDSTQTVGHCDIFNLSGDNEERIYKRRDSIVISAGHPQTLAEVFSGMCQQVRRKREGLARITRIDLGDMVRGVQRLSGWTSRTWAGANPIRTLVKDFAEDLGLPVGPLDAVPPDSSVVDWVWSSPSAAGIWSEGYRWTRLRKGGFVRLLEQVPLVPPSKLCLLSFGVHLC